MRPYWRALQPVWAANLRASHFVWSALLGIGLAAGSVMGVVDMQVLPGAAIFLVSLVLSLMPSFVRANVELYEQLAGEVDRLQEVLAAHPKLTFDFTDSWPYRYLPGDQRCSYRIKIENRGPVTAYGCRVVIVDADDAGWIDAALHWNQVRDYDRETLIDLPPNAGRLADVVAALGEPPVLSWDVVGVRHGNQMPARNGFRQQVRLRVEAQNAIQHPERTFEVYMDGDRAVDLRMRAVARTDS